MRSQRQSKNSDFAEALELFRHARRIESDAIAGILNHLVNLSAPIANDPSHSDRNIANVEEASDSRSTYYLSLKQIAARIPYAEKTIRHLILKGELVEGGHFFKRGGRLMFSWRAMQDWVEDKNGVAVKSIPLVRNKKNGYSK
jgi:hypothetical protein